MRLALNKNSLKHQRDQLTMFKRFLPSLDLKRQQLMGAWKESREQLQQAEMEEREFRSALQHVLPLLGSSTLRSRDLTPLVRLKHAELSEENVAGARVPKLKSLEFEHVPYSTFTLPFWVDGLVDAVEHAVRLRIRIQVLQSRTEKLGHAVRKITQRVNLFDKVLIPTAQKNIRKIQIALTDEERASVVRSKLSKRKNRG